MPLRASNVPQIAAGDRLAGKGAVAEGPPHAVKFLRASPRPEEVAGVALLVVGVAGVALPVVGVAGVAINCT